MNRGRGVVLWLCALLVVPAVAVAQEAPPERTYNSEHFSVTWIDDASHPDAPDLTDADGSGVPDSIEALAAAFERAREVEVEQWGFVEPPVEGRYPIYVGRASGQGFTRDAPGGEGRSKPSFIVAPPDYLSRGRADLEVFAAHEYFHAIQTGLDDGEPSWISEATATWAQHEFDPDHPEAPSLLRDFVPTPRLPLTHTGRRRHYGAFLFFRFLEERYGSGIVKELWEEMAVPEAIPDAPDRDAFGALEAVLGRRGTTIPDAWGLFHLWRRRLGHFERGEQYKAALAGSGRQAVLRTDVVRHESCRLAATGLDGSGLPPLSGDYMKIAPHRRAPATTRALLTAVGPPGARGFYVVNGRASGSDEVMLSFGDDGIARADVAFGRRQIRTLLVGLANGAPRGEEATIAYSLRLPGASKSAMSAPEGQSSTTFGTSVMLRGTVTCRNLPAPDAVVVVTERELVSGATRTYGARTSADGTWTLGVTPQVSSLYSVALVDPLLSPAEGPGTHLIGVRVAISMEVAPLNPQPGAPVTVSGGVAPLHPGAPVVIEYQRPGASRWIEGPETVVGPDGRYSAELVLPGEGDWFVRARLVDTLDQDHLAGSTAPRIVRVEPGS
jgi:hypothetical protein